MPPYMKTGEVYFGDTFNRPVTLAFCNDLEDESIMQKGSVFIPQSCEASFTAEVSGVNSINELCNYGISATVDTMQDQLQAIVSRVQALEDALKCPPAPSIRSELRTLNYKKAH